MKSSLFRDRPARKTRMTMMVAGAVLVHFGIVGVGARWQQPTTERRDASTVVEVTACGQEPSGDDIQYVMVANSAPTPIQANSTPTTEVPLPSDPLPAEVVPEMSESADAMTPPKPRRAASHTANTSATASPSRMASGVPGAPGGHPGALPGGPDVGRAGVQGWKTPRPPYPAALRATGLQGATTVRITTDANGNVATVEIVRSAGNLLMDRNTQGYVRDFWKGPPNSTRTTEFIYQLF